LTVRVGTAPVVATTARQTAIFSSSGTERFSFPLTVGAGRVLATLTFSGGGYRTLMMSQNGAIVAGPTTGVSPVVIDRGSTAGSYTFGVQGPSSAPFTLRVEYEPPGPPPPTTTVTTISSTTSSSTSTSTTSSSTTSTTPTTTTSTSTTTTVAGGRRTATFTGSGGQRQSFPLTVGAGRVIATLTFNGGGSRTLMILQGSVVAGPTTGPSPVIIDTSLTAGQYTFAVQGPSSAPFTLKIDYPKP
jgi:hypothetical protein